MAKKTLLKPEIKKILDKAVRSELYASNLYKQIANICQSMGLFGAQKYFLNESNEELNHYQSLVDYVNDMGDLIEMPIIPAVEESPKSLMEALNESYAFELELMHQYEKHYEDAEDKMDCITATFLIGFMQIQRKAVGEYADLISRLELAPNDLLEFDEYMGELVK